MKSRQRREIQQQPLKQNIRQELIGKGPITSIKGQPSFTPQYNQQQPQQFF